MIDDGTGTIRISLFRGAAEEMLGMKAEEIEASPDSVKSKIESLIGKEMLFEGRAKKNEQYERMEFNAFKVSISDPVEEAKKLLE
jgi:ssDNA-binding replication factor A large subunit